MILSISKRTDYPTFFIDNFYNAYKKNGGDFNTNPYNNNSAYINFNDVDCFVFWAKLGGRFIKLLLSDNDFRKYIVSKSYIQFTVNSYQKPIENIDITTKIKNFKLFSNIFGKQKVIWRYDPIFFDDKQGINIEYHKKALKYLYTELKDYTNRMVISLMDNYNKLQYKPDITENKFMELSKFIGLELNKDNLLEIFTCSEKYDLREYGIYKGACIDKDYIEKTFNIQLNSKRGNYRQYCQCVKHIDIGKYNTCKLNCVYCYANK